MEKMPDDNCIILTGRIMSEPELSHKTYGENFYIMYLGVTRKSGYEDRIPLMISERLLWEDNFTVGEMLYAEGQIRTYNQQVDGHNHLMIVTFVRKLEHVPDEEEMDNNVVLEGYICKETIRRTSPLGRELCDMMLAVNRMYNKSDYIPCIAWGRNAVLGGELKVGDKILIEGRLQSRKYKKHTEDGQIIEKTAFEVSVTRMEECG